MPTENIGRFPAPIQNARFTLPKVYGKGCRQPFSVIKRFRSAPATSKRPALSDFGSGTRNRGVYFRVGNSQFSLGGNTVFLVSSLKVLGLV